MKQKNARRAPRLRPAVISSAVAIAAITTVVAIRDSLGSAAQFVVAAVLVGVTWKYVSLTSELVKAQHESLAREARERHRVEVLMPLNGVLHLLDSYFIPHFIKWSEPAGATNVIRPRTREYFDSRVQHLADHAATIATHAPLLHDAQARERATTVVRDLIDLIDRARGVDEAFAQALDPFDGDITTFGEARRLYDDGAVTHYPRFDQLLSVGALNGYRARVAHLQEHLLALSPAYAAGEATRS